MTQITLIITNITKLAGLVVGLHAAFGMHPNGLVLGLAGFMMAGAQLSEQTIISLGNRFLGRPPQPPLEGDQPSEIQRENK